MQKELKQNQSQIDEKSEQIENQRINYERKMSELEDIKVKLPQA